MIPSTETILEDLFWEWSRTHLHVHKIGAALIPLQRGDGALIEIAMPILYYQ